MNIGDGGGYEFYCDTHPEEVERDTLISILRRTLDYGDELMASGKFDIASSYPVANWNGNAERVRKYLKKIEAR